MEQERPPFYSHNLKPVDITEQGLSDALQALETALQKGVEAAVREDGAKDIESSGSMYTGRLGTAYAFLWLDYQSTDTYNTRHSGKSDVAPATLDLLEEAKVRANASVDLSVQDINPGRPSPIASPTIGALVLRVLSGQWLEQDPKSLLAVVEIAISHPPTFTLAGHAMGVDEVLYGRAGLLWSVLEIWRRCPDQETQSAFAPVFQSMDRLVQAITESGRTGASAFRKATAKTVVPGAATTDASTPHEPAPKDVAVDMDLMWSWFDQFYGYGAMHGISGVLGILLDAALPRLAPSVVDSYPELAQSISVLCGLCVREGGHLPMGVPPRPTSRSAPLMQICHGAPGLLTLLAAAKRNPIFAAQHWSTGWDGAIVSAGDQVWKQGLLSKGCGLCHGLAGNALALVVLVDPLDDSTDGYLASALAMLLEAQSTPPFAPAGSKYRTPDHPWSLFEGLAGLLCAWSEACVLIKLKLNIMQRKKQGHTDPGFLAENEEIVALLRKLLGFPCLVGGFVGGTQYSFLR